MPLRAFGGRAAGGALGLQHGNVLTDAAGNIAVVFAVPFGAVPDVIPVVLDPANNYYVVMRTVNALGFTAHVRRLATSGASSAANSGNSTVNISPEAGGAAVNLISNGAATNVGVNTINAFIITGSGHTHTIAHTHSVDAAAGAGVTVMWMAMA